MVHLPIHLASEAKVVGPVQYRWMYPIERYLHTLKSYVRNKSCPEGSIVEGYIAKECTTFCPRYLHDVETKHDREEKNYVIENNITNGGGLTIFKCMGHTIGKSTSHVLSTEEWSQAHLYVLTNCEEVTSFIEEHKQSIRVKPSIHARDVDLIHTREFISWFEECIIQMRHEGPISEHILSLSYGPSTSVTCYRGYIINGFRFHTREREKGKKTQNNGVVVTIEVLSFASARDNNPIPGHVSYYGVLTNEMSHRRGRVQIVSLEDELDNLQQSSDIQPAATTTPSSSDPFDSLDPFVVGLSSSKKKTRGPTHEERLCHRPLHLSDDDWRWLIHFWGTPEAKDQFQQLLSQPEWTSSSTSASSGASTSVSSTSIASTYVDEIYTQVIGPERHGHVQGYGFGPTPTSVFGSTSRRRSRAILSTQLENAQEMLIAAEQKFTTATEELSNVKKTFEEKLIEVQRKTRE
uniref:DUF4218 domain-containing protein n=1 Tax=Vitis vinifera TaxID=29760 RepID=A5AS00_VITVI|nr:hypothetical protein VITISV_028848 [Vitis vinifera]